MGNETLGETLNRVLLASLIRSHMDPPHSNLGSTTAELSFGALTASSHGSLVPLVTITTGVI
jgi:hypothetical protein